MYLDPRELDLDTAEIIQRLRRWVECESPTWDAAAVNRMVDLAARDLANLGAMIERIPGEARFGACLRARFPCESSAGKGILILGHLDTVHPVGTFQPWREQDGLCFGPGVFDMKGGNVIALAALAALQKAGAFPQLPVTVLLTSDEEVGSPSSRALIEAEARRNRYVLVPEPARRDGGVVTGRYAISRFSVETRGKPSHAGLRLTEGSSAIREMAHQILAIEAMSDGETTYSVGVVRGGEWVNCVAEACHAEVLCAARSDADVERAARRLAELAPLSQGNRVVVRQTFTRPTWDANDACWDLYAKASNVARQLGFEIPHQSSGGGSDGNFTGALGVATLDGLGPRGEGPHTLNEHVVVESLVERARLLAGLLTSIG